jgi:hypothetical protein
VETPDFERCVVGFTDRTFEEQSLILRHIFGSQEALWARHLDGWSARRFEEVLTRLGFEEIELSSTTSDERALLVNVLVRARRPLHARARDVRVRSALAILEQALNGTNATEAHLFERWLDVFERTLAGETAHPERGASGGADDGR